MWADSHCHLPFDGVGDAAVEEAKAAGVSRMITIGTNAEESRLAIALARAHEGVWATIGLHPHDAIEGVDTISSILAESDPVVVGVGECGLDYHYDYSPRAVQREAFAAQIRLATQLDLALVVHTREAWDDTFDILTAEGAPDRWVLHCFTGGPAEVRRGLDLGAFVSFSGIVTFKSAQDVRAAAVLCPLDRLLVETDSPFLAPVPYRGRTNTPALVPVVGAAVAAERGVAPEVVEEATWANTATIFRLSPADPGHSAPAVGGPPRVGSAPRGGPGRAGSAPPRGGPGRAGSAPPPGRDPPAGGSPG